MENGKTRKRRRKKGRRRRKRRMRIKMRRRRLGGKEEGDEFMVQLREGQVE